MKCFLLAAVALGSLLTASSAFAEGNGEPFGIPSNPVLTARSVGQDTGSEGYPSFGGTPATVGSRTVASDTGSSAYPVFSGQAALTRLPTVQASN